MPPEELVRVVTPDGGEGLIPASQVGDLVASGGHIETAAESASRAEQEQYATLGEAAIHGAERLASGATIGLSDVALAELGGPEYLEERARRERLFPTLGTGAEVAGAIAPLIGTGGGSVAGRGLAVLGSPVRGAAAVGRGAEAVAGAGLRGLGITGESILGRGVLRGTEFAAGGMAEGALYGAGHALSEEALAGGNYDRLGEKLWAGAKEGLTVGGAIGGPLGFVAGAGSRAVERGYARLTGAKGLKELVQKFSDDQIGKSLGATSVDLKRLGRTATDRETQLAEIAKEVRAAKLRDGTQVFKAADDAEDLAEKLTIAKREAGGDLDTFRRQVDDIATGDPALQPDVGGFFRQVDAAHALAEAGPATLRGYSRKALREVEGLRKQADLAAQGGRAPLTISELTDWRKKLDEVLYPPKPKNGLPPPPPVHMAQVQDVRRMLEATIEEATERAAKKLGTAESYGGLKNRYRRLSQAEDIATGAAARNQGGRTISLTDYLSGIGGAVAGVASGSVLPLLGAGALAVANKLARERGSSVLAVLADRVAKVDRRIDTGVNAYIKRLGDVRRGGIAELSGEDVEKKNRIDRALGKKPSETRIQAYQRKVGEVSRFSVNELPEVERRIGTDLASAAPVTTMAATQTAIRGMQFLQTKLPAPFKDTSIALPQFQDRQVAPVEAVKFGRYVQIVDDPISVVDEMRDGTLAPEHTEALANVYPELYSDIRDRTWQRLATMKEPPAYTDRVRFGRLWNLPTSRSLTPESVEKAQAVYAAQMQAQQAAAPTSGGGGGGKSVSQGLASRVDQLESAELTV